MSVETNSHNYTNMNLTFSQFFIPAPNSPKQNSGTNGKFLPKSRIFSCWKIPLPRLVRLRSLRPCEAPLLTLLLHLRHPNSKKIQPKFCGILSPENCFRKISSALFQISSSGFISKKVRILSRVHRKFSKRVSEAKIWSARSAVCSEFPPKNPESERVRHAERGSSFANTKL